MVHWAWLVFDFLILMVDPNWIFFLVFVQPLTLGWVWFYWFRVISHWVFGKGFWLPRSRWVLLSFIIHTTYSNSSSIMPVAVEDKCSIKMTAQPPNLGSPRLHGRLNCWGSFEGVLNMVRLKLWKVQVDAQGRLKAVSFWK